MAGNYWIKLYIEILDDSKMATLPDRLWRRVIELFMLAGRYYKNGQLPDTNELAWALRMPMGELDLDLKQISQVGIIKKNEHGWVVVNFSKRQAKMTPAEKMRLYREKMHREEYYGEETTTTATEPVTLSNASVTQITDNRYRSEAEADKRSNIFNLYEQTIGMVPHNIVDELKDAEKTYNHAWLEDAFKISAVRNKRNWGYVKGILKRYETEGYVPYEANVQDKPDPRNIATEVY